MMALLEVLKFPDPRLHIKAKPITTIDADLHRIVDDMYETMYHQQGIGLAGTQVDIHQQIFTMDVSEARKDPLCVLNPEIIHSEGMICEPEGCLSVIGAYDKVDRAAKVRLRYMNLDGKTVEIDAEGLMAHCIQHEVDHLNGILFVNRLSRLKQERIRKKIGKFK